MPIGTSSRSTPTGHRTSRNNEAGVLRDPDLFALVESPTTTGSNASTSARFASRALPIVVVSHTIAGQPATTRQRLRPVRGHSFKRRAMRYRDLARGKQHALGTTPQPAPLSDSLPPLPHVLPGPASLCCAHHFADYGAPTTTVRLGATVTASLSLAPSLSPSTIRNIHPAGIIPKIGPKRRIFPAREAACAKGSDRFIGPVCATDLGARFRS